MNPAVSSSNRPSPPAPVQASEPLSSRSQAPYVADLATVVGESRSILGLFEDSRVFVRNLTPLQDRYFALQERLADNLDDLAQPLTTPAAVTLSAFRANLTELKGLVPEAQDRLQKAVDFLKETISVKSRTEEKPKVDRRLEQLAIARQDFANVPRRVDRILQLLS